MSLQRHIVSGPASSFALVQLGETRVGDGARSHVRAVFQSPGDGRRKAAFACCPKELAEFLRVIDEGVNGESALVTLLHSRGFLEVVIIDSGQRKIRYEIHSSRTRTGESCAEIIIKNLSALAGRKAQLRDRYFELN